MADCIMANCSTYLPAPVLSPAQNHCAISSIQECWTKRITAKRPSLKRWISSRAREKTNMLNYYDPFAMATPCWQSTLALREVHEDIYQLAEQIEFRQACSDCNADFRTSRKVEL